MPSAVPLPNPNFPTGPIPGLPGAAYQPTSMAAMGMPGEAYLGQGFVPQAAPAAPMPVAETPVNMPTRRGGLSNYAKQLQSAQRGAGQPLGARTPQWVQQAAKIRNEAPQMFSRPTDAGGSMGNLTPRTPQSFPRAVANATAPGPTYGPPSPAPQFRAGPGGEQTPEMGAKVMKALTGQRPTAISQLPAPPSTPSASPAAAGRFGRAGQIGRGALRHAAPFLAGVGMSVLGNELDAPSLTAAGGATSYAGGVAGMAGAPMGAAIAVPALGVGIGDAVGRPWTKALGGALNEGKADSGIVPLDMVADLIGKYDRDYGDSALGIPDWLREPMARGERGIADIPVIGDLLGGGGGEGEEAAAPRQIVPTELPSIMSSIGLSPEIQQTALDQMNQDAQLRRIYAEQRLPFPGDVDEEGNPVLRDPAEIDQIVAQQFVMSLPELMDMDREQQAALSRAAMFQTAMGDIMGPYQDASNALADSYAGLLNVEGLAPEIQGPMANYANALAAQTRGTANAYGAMGAAIPATIGLESYMQQQQALQAQMQQQLMQAQIDAMTNPAAAGTEADILG